MKTRAKRIWLALAVLTAIAVVGLVWKKAPPPQIVTLPNGQRYKLAGTTYGTNHVHGTAAARLVNLLPAPAANFIRKRVGTRLGPVNSRTTPRPSLCVWFDPLGTNGPFPGGFRQLRTMLADQNGVVAGNPDYPGAWVMWSANRPVVSMTGSAMYEQVPRRSPVLQLCLFESLPNDQYHEIGRVRFSNPLYRRFPEWQPEPLPVVKKAGDLEVRLNSIATGTPDSRPALRGEQAWTLFDVSLSSSRGTNEVWATQSAELSDATGNIISGNPPSSILSGHRRNAMPTSVGYRESIKGTLWPDEPAWRLKLELKRKAGFAPEEFVTFKNVPVPRKGAPSIPPITNRVGGAQLVLKEFVQIPPSRGGLRPAGQIPAITWTLHTHNLNQELETLVAVELLGQPEGVAVDFVKLTTDTGDQRERCGEAWGEFSCAALLRFIPTNVATVDITWVVQKTRSVEFLVKPPKAE